MYILKKYSKNKGKGILIVTHNEVSQLVFTYLKSIKNKYYIIQHVQFNVPINYINLIDLNLMPLYNIVKDKDKDIPIATNTLIHKTFNYVYNENNINLLLNLLKKYNIEPNLNKYETRPIDILYVGRINELKKTIDVLNYFIYAANLNKKCMFLLLDQGTKSINYIKQFYNIYNFLDINIKKNIIIVDTHKLNITDNPCYLGFKLDDVALFYKNSKIYIHACENEGGSRSIHEAICSGCYILTKENMEGGGNDNLPLKGNTLYNDNNYKVKILEAFEKQIYYHCNEKNIENISEIYTIEKLLKILYNKLKYVISYDEFKNECDTELIQLKMAAHDFTVPWYINGELTSTIKTQKQLEIFMNNLQL